MSDDYGTVFMGKIVGKTEVAHKLPLINEECFVAEEDACPLCGGGLDMVEVWYKIGCALYKCNTCGLAVFR